jgi:DNA replication protein DnaC
MRKLVSEYRVDAKIEASTVLSANLSLSAKEMRDGFINGYKFCDVLLIDDLGKEKMTESTSAKFFEVINHRYEQKKPLIITTRFGGDALKKRFAVSQDVNIGNDIFRRLGEMLTGLEF